MKITTRKFIYPMAKGLHKSSVPGTQDPSSLTKAKNVILRTKPSIKKRPGLRRIPHTGDNDGVQAACHFFGTYGSGQVDEIVRVRKGRLEVIRDDNIVDLDSTCSDNDSIVFEKYGNLLIIHFENSRPVYYQPRGTSVSNLDIISSHTDSPPSIGRMHDFRYWYSGRPADPHKIWVSATNFITDFTLRGGGFSMRVKDGDGDPVGITAISPPFRGDLYTYKWSSIYRIFRSQYGYGIDDVTNEVGAVNHNCVVATQNDVYSVGNDAINSLVMTDKYGAAESSTITYPIYEYFQENINWSNAKNMIMTYDKPSNTLLLSYTSSGASVNNKVLGLNTVTREFFEWEDCEYSVLGRYWDFGRQKTLVHCADVGTAHLDDETHLLGESPINMHFETGQIMPAGDPKSVVTFTQAWLIAKPTTKSVTVTVGYSFDGRAETTVDVDTAGDGYGSLIDEDEGGLIGVENIGEMRQDWVALPFKCEGDASAVKFSVKQEPPETDPDQPCEIYGFVYEFQYDEDTDLNVKV